MSRAELAAAALKSAVEIIVSNPNDVEINTRTESDLSGREVTSFEINVHKSDRGKLIGKGGANLKALRVLMNSAAYVAGVRYRVSCKDFSGQDRTDRHGVSRPLIDTNN